MKFLKPPGVSRKTVDQLRPQQLKQLQNAATDLQRRPYDDLAKSWLMNVIDLLHLDPESAIDWVLTEGGVDPAKLLDTAAA